VPRCPIVGDANAANSLFFLVTQVSLGCHERVGYDYNFDIGLKHTRVKEEKARDVLWPLKFFKAKLSVTANNRHITSAYCAVYWVTCDKVRAIINTQ